MMPRWVRIPQRRIILCAQDLARVARLANSSACRTTYSKGLDKGLERWLQYGSAA
jgi:hypothetical protein